MSGVHVATVYRWAERRQIRARRLARTGPWRVLVDVEGFPVDAPDADERCSAA